MRLSVSRSNAPSPESVHEDLPDYEDAPEAGSHTSDQRDAEDEDESEGEDELEEDNKVASDTDYSNPLPDSSPHLPSALGLDFTSPIDLTQDDQHAQVLAQLAGIDLRGSTDDDESRLRQAEAFIASAVLHSQSSPPASSPPEPPESLHEHHGIQSTTMTVRRVGRYETIYTLSDTDPDSDDDDENYFEVSRPGITRWSSSPPSSTVKHTRAPTHRELSLHPRLSSFLSVVPPYASTWGTQNGKGNGGGMVERRGLLRRG